MGKILIACEESQAVCIEMRKSGHEAFSCDTQDCSGGFPEWHIKEDVLKVIAREHWDMMIAFPPCTFLTCRAQSHNIKLKRWAEKKAAIEFFMQMINAPIKRIAVENPKGIMNSGYRKPDQIIQPFYFGDPHRKMTCLWLKGLPKLKWTKQNNLFETQTAVEEEIKYFRKDGKPIHWVDSFAPTQERQKLRSKTFPSIAKAMGSQWGEYLTAALADEAGGAIFLNKTG